MIRTLGIEEEFFLVDPGHAVPASMSDGLHAEFTAAKLEGTSVHRELLECQVEIVTGICTTASQALDALLRRRASLEEICRVHSLVPFASGTPLRLPEQPLLASGQRYERIADFVPGIVREHFINGLHIHVHVPDENAGIIAINALRRWLPLLVGMGANSPIWNGAYSGFDSWRTVHYRRWSVIGVPPVFRNAEEYHQQLSMMISGGGILDAGHIGWYARLSAGNPTIEVRAADAQLTARDSVALAVLIRAIVDTAVQRETQTDCLHGPMLDLSLWQAAKDGLNASFFDCDAREHVTGQTMMERMLDYAGGCLRRNGDEDFVDGYLADLLAKGTGATLQKSSWISGGASQVISDASRLFSRG